MPLQKPSSVLQLNPILGFGPVGWIASVVLLAIIALAIAGYDFQWHFIWLIYHLFDGHTAVKFVNRVLVPHGLLWDNALFGLVSAGLVVIAIFISPVELPWWRCAVVTAWAVIHPPIFFYIRSRIGNSNLFDAVADRYMQMIIQFLLSNLLTCAFLGLLMRSAWVAFMCAAATTLVTIIQIRIYLTMPPPPGFVWGPQAFDMWTGLGWQVAIGGACLWWAVRARQRVFEPWQCQCCGYDLRGTPTSRCPECGTPLISSVSSQVRESEQPAG